MKKIMTMLSAAIILCVALQCTDRPEPAASYVTERLPKEYYFEGIAEAFIGELIYVPSYGRIYHIDDENPMALTITLAIHNTDLENPITIRMINCYALKGNLLKRYLEEAKVLEPLETTKIVIGPRNELKEAASNFVIQWVADAEVSSPAVEALMVNTSYHQGVSFLTNGKVIKRFGRFYQ